MKPTRPNTDIPAWLQTTTTTPTPAIKAKFWQRLIGALHRNSN